MKLHKTRSFDELLNFYHLFPSHFRSLELHLNS